MISCKEIAHSPDGERQRKSILHIQSTTLEVKIKKYILERAKIDN